MRYHTKKIIKKTLLIVFFALVFCAIGVFAVILYRSPDTIFGSQKICFAVDGEILTYDVSFGKSYKIDVPERVGYTFQGLYNDKMLTDRVVDANGESDGRFLGRARSTTLYASWSERAYSEVTYYVGTQPVSLSLSRLYEGQIYSLPVPNKEGYDFNGWYYQGTAITDEQGRLLSAWDKPALVSVDLNADLSLREYTVTVRSTPEFSSQKKYTVQTLDFSLEIPLRAGYVFEGFLDEDGNLSSEVMIKRGSVGNRVFDVAWTPVRYPLAYDLDGGVAELPSYYTVEDDFTLNEPTRTGYRFAGWRSDAFSGTKASVTLSHEMGAKSFTATWTLAEYEIAYDLKGGEGVNPQSYTMLQTVMLSAPTRDAYLFTGWSGTDLVGIQKEVSFEGATGNRRYVANWTPISYAISYELNGGVAASNPDSYTIEDDVVLATPTKKGYTFEGWRCGTGLQKNVRIHGETGARHYEANWSLTEYTITYEVANGTVNGVTSYTMADKVVLCAPSRDGYEFLGWSGTDLETVSKEVSFESATGNRHYVANWAPVTYNITYDLKGGALNGNNPTAYTTEDACHLSAPSKTGYNFAGWQESGSNEVVKDYCLRGKVGNKTLVAVYTPFETTVYCTAYAKDVDDAAFKGTAPKLASGTVTCYYGTRNKIEVTVDSTRYYNVEGIYDVASDAKVANGNGICLANVEGLTDSQGRWICLDESRGFKIKFKKTYADYTYVENALDLVNIGKDMKGKYMLVNDVNISGSNWAPIGGTNSPKAFEGVIDGSGHKIIGLTRKDNVPEKDSRSYFGFVGNLVGTIKSLSFEEVNIKITGPSNNNSGMRAFYAVVAGKAKNATIKNVSISGSFVYSDCTNGESWLGGIVGYAVDTTISNCVNNIDVTVDRHAGAAGGIVGFVEGGSVTYCKNVGTIKAVGTDWLGYAMAGEIAVCTHKDNPTYFYGNEASGSTIARAYDNSYWFGDCYCVTGKDYARKENWSY